MTIALRDFKDEKIEITENNISISGKSDDKEYDTKLNFFAGVDAENSKYQIQGF